MAIKLDFLYTEDTAKQIIENFKTQLKEYCLGVAQGTEVGILNVTKQFIWYVNSVRDIYGVRVAGTALEDARSQVDISEPWLYYDAREGTPLDQDQDDWIADFLADLKAVADEYKNMVEEIKRYEEEKKQAQEELEKTYKRERKNIRAMAKRKGVSVELPTIPKKITSGSLKRLISIKGKLSKK